MKPLNKAKTRLANVLSEKERHDLVFAFFQHTLEQLQNCEYLSGILVISADINYKVLCDSKNIVFLQEEQENGLNSSIHLGALFLMSRGIEAMLVVHGDLPLLTSFALDDLFIKAESPGVGIVPDRHRQGTNILLTAPPNIIDFQFGINSYQNHLKAAQELNIPLNIVFSDTLSVDIDTPEDLIFIKRNYFHTLENLFMKQINDFTGLSAGSLCLSAPEPNDQMTLATIQAAKNLGISNRSSWTLTEVWQDGTTLWMSPTENQQALVSADGLINILFIPDQNEW